MPCIYFISDAHIGGPFADAREWETNLASFLESIPNNAAALYILGDLFDFWIEYGAAVRSDYFPTLCALQKLRSRGIPIHYFAGNHDFAFGPFITQTLGMDVHFDSTSMILQGKRVHLFHGDGLIKRDPGYRILKWLLRNPVNQALYKLLPPQIGIGLGDLFSAASRKKGERFMNEQIVAEYRRHARRILDGGDDIVFFGHSHWAELSRWGTKVYCNTGAWMRHYNYATMCDGVVRLWKYLPGREPQELPEIDRNAASSAS